MSRKSHSSPNTQRRPESFPLIMPMATSRGTTRSRPAHVRGLGHVADRRGGRVHPCAQLPEDLETIVAREDILARFRASLSP